MRSLLGILSLLALAGVSEPAAADYQYPWCAHYGRSGAVNCGFVSFEQCRWTISGLGGFCAQNPFYAAARSLERPRIKNKRRSRY